jgi:hypothetical protein
MIPSKAKGSPWRTACCRAARSAGRRRLAPENVGCQFLSLLQSAPDQTLSAHLGSAEKPNCRRLLRAKLGGSRAERYGKSLSECRFVSEAWGLADLLYKLFSVTFQYSSLIAQPEGWYPFAPQSGRSKVPNPSLSAPSRKTSPPPPHTRSPHTGRMGNNLAHGHAVARHADRPRGARRHRRAGDIPQRRDRFLRSACEGARAPRSRHDCRSCRHDLRRRMDHGLWWLGQRRHAVSNSKCAPLPALQAERRQLAGKRGSYRTEAV